MKIAGTRDIAVQVELTRLADLLCSAFEGGSNYWYKIVSEQPPRAHGAEYFHEVPFAPGGWLTLSTLDGDVNNGRTQWTLDLGACIRGAAIMAQKYPTSFAEFMSEGDDANTGDVYLQC